MPHTITVAPEHELAVVRMSGTVDGVEIVTTAAEIVAHPDWQSGFRPVWDVTRVTGLDVSPEHMEAILAQESHFEETGDGGDSVVITRDDIATGLMVIVEAHASASPTLAADVSVRLSVES